MNNAPIVSDPDKILVRGNEKPAGGCVVRFTGASVSSDSNVSILPVPNEVVATKCERLAGGAKKPSAPVFVPEVKNEGDLLLREDNFILVQEDNSDTIIVDNA
jgi:hypothetical protein